MGNAWASVFRADLKRITRDRFLMLIVFYLPVLATAMRWAIPWLAHKLEGRFDITPYYPLVGAVIVLTLPFMMGVILGMQLLEEKDERSLSAVAVTPFSFERYYAFRLAIYAVVGMVMLVMTHFILGIVSIVPLWKLILTVLTLGFNTALSSLIPPIVAKNQVQGFAVLKGSGVLFMGPVFSFFVPRHWDLFFGVIPFYWPIKAYFLAASQGSIALFWLAIGAGMLMQSIAFWLLYNMFKRKILEA